MRRDKFEAMSLTEPCSILNTAMAILGMRVYE